MAFVSHGIHISCSPFSTALLLHLHQHKILSLSAPPPPAPLPIMKLPSSLSKSISSLPTSDKNILKKSAIYFSANARRYHSGAMLNYIISNNSMQRNVAAACGVRRFYSASAEQHEELSEDSPLLGKQSVHENEVKSKKNFDERGSSVSSKVRAEIQQRKFHLKRVTEFFTLFDPHPNNYPFQEPEKFILPPFFTKDDRLVKRLNKEGDNIDVEKHVQTFAQKRIYVLYLIWRAYIREGLDIMREIMANKPEELSTAEVNELIHICTFKMSLGWCEELFEHYIVNGSVKPDRTTFLLMIMNTKLRQEEFTKKMAFWEELMKKHNIEWDTELLSAKLAMDANKQRSGATPYIEAFMEAFWWPLSSKYNSDGPVPADAVIPTAETYNFFISILYGTSRTQYAEAAFASFLDNKDDFSPESYEHMCHKMLMFFAKTKQTDHLLQMLEEHFLHKDEERIDDNDNRFYMTEKMSQSMLFVLIQGRDLPWEGSLKVFEWCRREIDPKTNVDDLKPYILLMKKILQTGKGHRPEVMSAAYNMFLAWFSPEIERKQVTVNAPKQDTEVKDSNKKKATGKDELVWTTYDLRAFEEDYEQYKRDEDVEVEKVENYLNHYTPKVEIHETLRFSKRFIRPSEDDYRNMMNFIVNFGTSEQADNILRIFESDNLNQMSEDIVIDMYCSMIALYVREKNLTKALILFLREFSSSIRGSKGKKVPPEHLLLLFREAFSEAEASKLEAQFDAQLRRTRERKMRHYGL